jgi:hypothetical protein
MPGDLGSGDILIEVFLSAWVQQIRLTLRIKRIAQKCALMVETEGI